MSPPEKRKRQGGIGGEPQGSPLGAFVKYHASVLPSPHDVFFWSVLVGDEKIMPKLWASCESPIVVALLASYLCLGVEKEVSWGSAEVHERAQMLGWNTVRRRAEHVVVAGISVLHLTNRFLQERTY